METDQVVYDHEMTLPSGTRMQCSSTYVWPDAQTIEAQGGLILEEDQDGVPLFVLWPLKRQCSFNPERLSVLDVELRLQAVDKVLKSMAKEYRKAKGFKRG